MWLGSKKAPKNSEEKISDDRQRVINYKKFFESPEGKSVLIDLMNNFSHGINPNPGRTEYDTIRSAGKNDVMCFIFARAKQKMEDFDRLLNGE